MKLDYQINRYFYGDKEGDGSLQLSLTANGEVWVSGELRVHDLDEFAEEIHRVIGDFEEASAAMEGRIVECRIVCKGEENVQEEIANEDLYSGPDEGVAPI